MQRFWRKAIGRKKLIMERLQLAWNQTFADFMEGLGKKKQSRKGKRSKEGASSRYFGILSTIRQQVLLQHYMEQKRAYILRVRQYLQARATSPAVSPPVFSCDMDEDVIKALIEKAADLSEQNSIIS